MPIDLLYMENLDKVRHARLPQGSVAESVEFNLVEFVNFVYSRRRITFAMAVVIVLGLLIYFTAIQRSIYKAMGTININMSSKSDSFQMSRYTSWMEEQEMTTKVYMTERFFESAQFHRAVVDEVTGQKGVMCLADECAELRSTIQHAMDLRKMRTLAEKLEFVFSRLSIHSDSTHYLITVSATDREREVAHALTAMAMHTLVNLNYQLLLTKNSKVREFLTAQTRDTSKSLSQLEMALVNEQKRHNLIGTAETETRLTAIHIEQDQRLSSLIRDKMSLDLLEKEIAAEIKGYKTEISSSNSVSFLYLSQLQKRFDLLKYQIAVEASEKRGPASASSNAASLELEQYEKILVAEGNSWAATDIWDHIRKAETLLVDVRQQREKLNSEIAAAQQSNELWRKNYLGLPDVLRKLTELKRNIQISTEVYTSLKTRLQEINIRDAERANDLAILALPEVPSEPVGLPFSKKILVTLLSGPAASVFLMLLLYILVPLVRSSRDIEALGVRVLGSIRQYRNKRTLLPTATYPQIFSLRPGGSEANSLRYIRFRLEQEFEHNIGKGRGKAIAITSFNPSEGKTFLTVNLASAFAISGIRVLIVDLDIKYSDLSLYFEKCIGTKEIRSEHSELEFTLRRYSDKIEVLSSRDRNADVRDYVQGHEFATVFERLRDEYDLIIFDTAPVSGNVEAYLIAELSDATVFVVNHRSTLKDQVARGIVSLQEASHGRLFSVLNFAHDEVKMLRWRKRISA